MHRDVTCPRNRPGMMEPPYRNTLGTFRRAIAIITPGKRLVAAGQADQSRRKQCPRTVSSMESAIASRLDERRFHALVTHGDPVRDGDRREFPWGPVRLVDARLGRLRLATKGDVAGRGLVPCGRNTDEWLMNHCFWRSDAHRVVVTTYVRGPLLGPSVDVSDSEASALVEFPAHGVSSLAYRPLLQGRRNICCADPPVRIRTRFSARLPHPRELRSSREHRPRRCQPAVTDAAIRSSAALSRASRCSLPRPLPAALFHESRAFASLPAPGTSAMSSLRSSLSRKLPTFPSSRSEPGAHDVELDDVGKRHGRLWSPRPASSLHHTRTALRHLASRPR